MKNSKNSIQNSESKRHLYIFLCAAVLIGLTVFALGDVAETMMTDKGVDTHLSSAKVEALGHTRFRFRRIYNGGDVSAHHASSTVSPSLSNSTSVSRSHAVAAPSTSAPSSMTMPSAGGAGYAMHTSSSQEPHSYGGGSAMGGMGLASSVSSSAAPSAPMAYSSVSATLPSRLHRSSLSGSTMTDMSSRAAGPMRILSTEGDGSYHGEPSDDGKYWDESSWSWVDTDPTKEGDHLGEVGEPLGDAPWLLLLLLFGGYALFCARRRRAAAE